MFPKKLRSSEVSRLHLVRGEGMTPDRTKPPEAVKHSAVKLDLTEYIDYVPLLNHVGWLIVYTDA